MSGQNRSLSFSNPRSIVYNVLLFLFTLGVAFTLHWASDVFFSQIALDPIFLLKMLAAGAIMVIAIPIVELVKDLLIHDDVGDYESTIDVIKENNVASRSNVVISRATVFLVSYLIVLPVVQISPLSAELMRTSFSNIISAAGFGFVIYTMLAET